MTSRNAGLRRTRRGFEDAAEDDFRTIGDASCYASGEVVDGGAGLRNSFKTSAVLKSFAGIDGHYREGEFGLQFVEYRFACSNR